MPVTSSQDPAPGFPTKFPAKKSASSMEGLSAIFHGLSTWKKIVLTAFAPFMYVEMDAVYYAAITALSSRLLGSCGSTSAFLRFCALTRPTSRLVGPWASSRRTGTAVVQVSSPRHNFNRCFDCSRPAWFASLEGDEFFSADGAPPEVAAVRKAGFEKLGAHSPTKRLRARA